ncbi:hypothetical protein F2Q69_00060135 [Brassica cretica]|uniref:Uncharacterized protein n=1 Tax=Brassica cretica TaxID=69181 RepID=A0A8S9RA71_BRACR|nr:hypothetical protein F2Q69_00060135 [Brassica cretica]
MVIVFEYMENSSLDTSVCVEDLPVSSLAVEDLRVSLSSGRLIGKSSGRLPGKSSGRLTGKSSGQTTYWKVVWADDLRGQKPKTRPLRKAWKTRPLVTGVTKREDGGIGYAPLAINSLSLSLDLSKALFDERRFDVSFGDSSRRRLLRCLSSAASSPVTLLGDLSLCGPPQRVGALSGLLVISLRGTSPPSFPSVAQIEAFTSDRKVGTQIDQAQSLRNYRTRTLPVATQRPSVRPARSLRSDRASVLLGRYVETELRPSILEHSRRYDASPYILVYPSMLSPEDRSEPVSCFPPFEVIDQTLRENPRKVRSLSKEAVINASSQKTAQRDLRHDSRPSLRFLNQQPVSRMTVYAWFARKDR